MSSTSSTGLLDPIPTQLYTHTPPLNTINTSLVSGYVPQALNIHLLNCSWIKLLLILIFYPIPGLYQICPSSLKSLTEWWFNSHVSTYRATVAWKTSCLDLDSFSTETAVVKMTNDLFLATADGLVWVLVLTCWPQYVTAEMRMGHRH